MLCQNLAFVWRHQVGQVIIKDEKISMHMWKLGRIERLISGSDENVRTADIYLPGTDTCNILLICYIPIRIK